MTPSGFSLENIKPDKLSSGVSELRYKAFNTGTTGELHFLVFAKYTYKIHPLMQWEVWLDQRREDEGSRIDHWIVGLACGKEMGGMSMIITRVGIMF